jgi:hypothetical protein
VTHYTSEFPIAETFLNDLYEVRLQRRGLRCDCILTDVKNPLSREEVETDFEGELSKR